MSFALKCIVGVFVVLCCVQFIEMARVRRDEVAHDPANDLKNVVDSMVSKVKSALDDDTLKKLVDAATNTIKEGAKIAQEHISKISDSAANAVGSG